MVGHEMAAALGAVLAVAHRRLHELADEFRSLGDFHILGFPQGDTPANQAGVARSVLTLTSPARLNPGQNPGLFLSVWASGPRDVDRVRLRAQTWGHWQGGHAMSQPIEMPRQQLTEQALSLASIDTVLRRG
jgi:hypothetical protein